MPSLGVELILMIKHTKFKLIRKIDPPFNGRELPSTDQKAAAILPWEITLLYWIKTKGSACKQ